jgi:hypothetical protein
MISYEISYMLLKWVAQPVFLPVASKRTPYIICPRHAKKQSRAKTPRRFFCMARVLQFGLQMYTIPLFQVEL